MVGATRERPESVASVLYREGLAYAMGGDPYGPATADSEQTVIDAVDVLGSSQQVSDFTAILYGDAVAANLGWAPAGVGEYDGYRWTIARAARQIAEHGAPAALREAATI